MPSIWGGAWRKCVVHGDMVVVHGSVNDPAVPGNMRTLGTCRRRVIRLWRRQLCLRSQKARLSWPRLKPFIRRWMPTRRILPPFPSVRVDAMHPREESYAGVPHVRMRAGGAGCPAFLPP
jgi:RNA-directed DNA polymerase